MRASHFLSSVLLAGSLVGCSLVPEPELPPPPSPYTDLPGRTSTLSGVVYDPEAFFFLLANWPSDPEHPEEDPPPALYDGVPFLLYSSVPQAGISVLAPDDSVGGSTEGSFTGSWQLSGVPSSNTVAYSARATPPGREFVLGEAYMDPEAPPPPVTAPMGTYYPTRTLRPIVPHSTLCQLQVATMVGDAGALTAIANTMTDMGTPTTVADLMDTTKTAGVALLWVYAPSYELDIFTIPADSIAAETNMGQLFAIEWAPPDAGIPGQSPMGYMAIPDAGAMSSLGYYAVVLPPKSEVTEPLQVTFNDTVILEEGDFPRPWVIPPVVEEIREGVSFGRVFSFPGGEPPPEDETAEPVPFPESNSQCYPEAPGGMRRRG
ncbi:hypothetical protein [Archangium violaceum]|nr:hypothetical protein [Archangium violaceum]